MRPWQQRLKQRDTACYLRNWAVYSMSITRYLARTYNQMQACITPQDKVLILANRALYPFIHYARKITRRYLVKDYPLTLWNIRYHTKDGVFLCRKFTNDFEILSPAYEEPLRPFFCLREGVFVDVGAHVGKYTVMVGRLLGNNGRVIAIEPHPRNFHGLLQNIYLNHLENVIALKKACTARPREVFLHEHVNISGSSTKYNFGKGGTIVQGEPLDNILKNLNITEINLLKIDVEGAEMDVLEGAKQTLTRSSNIVVIIEAWSNDAVHFLQHYGFKIQKVDIPSYFVAIKDKM